ncbi:MAG: hypothetical protein ACPG7E_01915, partial [Marinirhabdus sp.]
MMRFLYAPLFLMVLTTATAQNFEDTWAGYFSYNNIKDITEANNKLYVASDNAVYTYNRATAE